MTNTETETLRAEVYALKAALESTLAYCDRLKKERDGARGENAALKSKLADAATAPSLFKERGMASPIAKALSGGVRSGSPDARLDTRQMFRKPEPK